MKSQRFTLKSYTVAAATLALGVLLSLRLADWGWFSRSGSLVVVNGIILTSQQIIEHMHDLSRSHRQRAHPINRDWADDEKYHFIHTDHRLRWMSEKQGLYMLIAGTLVWGFGDLLNQL